MSKAYGFEREYFVLNKAGGPVLVPSGIPMDDCGWLAEARGDPHENPLKAAYLMLAEEQRIAQELRKKDLELAVGQDYLKLPPLFRKHALRTFGKTVYAGNTVGSMYNKDYSPTDTLARAGLHVHFSDFINVTASTCATCHKPITTTRVAGILDMPQTISLLDLTFLKRIRQAKRLPGLYEMKDHGYEYRSLPTSVDPRQVADVLLNKKITETHPYRIDDDDYVDDAGA